MIIGIIGDGAIGTFVRQQLLERDFSLRALLISRRKFARQPRYEAGILPVTEVADLPEDIDHIIDCAGHQALRMHGPAILRRGIDLSTVSIGALADPLLYEELEEAAAAGKATLHLASGAIGALDCLRAARVGKLHSVTYVGRKPPAGWKGSPADHQLDLDKLSGDAALHFEGSAREAAIGYPKNANVAAAVALAGVGFDDTRVQLIADPNIDKNIHEIKVAGDFGQFAFQIDGNSLPDNPRSSALAAMSAVSLLEQANQRIRF